VPAELPEVQVVKAPSTATPKFALPVLPDLRDTKVFGRKICYYDIGQGPPLVLVHGVGGDADQWAFCFKDLAASHRVIAIDLLGFGRSDKPLIDYRIAGYVEVLDRFLTSIRTHMRTVFELMFYDKSMVTDELVDLAYSLHLERGDGYTIKSVLETLADTREKLDAKLAQISAPALIVWGEDDAITPLSMARAFHSGIAGSLLQTIPRCGHFPPIEKPNEFVAAVTAFLRAG